MKYPDDWSRSEVGNLVFPDEPICYGVLKPGDFHHNGIPLVRIVDIVNNRVHEEDLFRISNKLDNEFKRSRLKGGELLVSIQGTVGRVALAPTCLAGANISRTIARVSIDAKIADKFYVRHWLLSGDGERVIRDAILGTTRDSLNLSALRKIEVPHPQKLVEQSKIAEVLSKVDQAIEQTESLIAKQQRIKTGLMQDLLTRGIDEHGNLRSEETHEFKDSPLGRIPVEWEPSTLGKLAKFNSGYAFKNEELAESGWRVVRISNLHKPDFPYWHYEGPVKESWKIFDGDILFSWAGVASSIDCVRYQGPEALMNQHIYNLIFESDSLRSFVYFFLQQYLPVLRTEIEGGAGQLHLTKAKIQGIHIPTMNPDELKKILAVLEQNEKQINETRNQLSKLCSLKTALMQDLLTGKKRVTPLMKNMEVCS